MRATEFVVGQVPADEIVDEDAAAGLAMASLKQQERQLKIRKARQRANDSLKKLHDVEAKPVAAK